MISDAEYSPTICKTLYKLTGNEAIDVLAQSEREYTWTIYVLNEGSLSFKVIFKNPTTKEYLFYEIYLTVVKSPPLETIQLTTCVRIPVSYTINLQNHIKNSVIYNIKPTISELSYENILTIPPYSEVIRHLRNPLRAQFGNFFFAASIQNYF